MKYNWLILSILGCLLIFSACNKRAQCPAYMEPQQGTISVQDAESMSPDEIRAQSQKLLNTQDSYIAVKRDKKTGLVKGKVRVKRGQNYTKRHKGFKTDPRTLQGVK
jgi:hypothetical protein